MPSQVGRKTISGKAARKVEPPSRMSIAIDGNETMSPSMDDDRDIWQLKVALEALVLPGMRLKEYKRLPFLTRNVRKGFKSRCRKAGVRTEPKESPPARVKVLYRYCPDDDTDSDSSSDEDKGRYEDKVGGMSRWLCPLCQVHGEFDTREMLNFHLSEDHTDVKTSWQDILVNGVCSHPLTFLLRSTYSF